MAQITQCLIILALLVMAVQDTKERTIANKTIGLLLLSGIILKVTEGATLIEWVQATGLCCMTIVGMFIAWRFRLIGGGDAKLTAVLVFIIGDLTSLEQLVLSTSIATIGLVGVALSIGKLNNLRTRGLPMAVPLAAGYIWTFMSRSLSFTISLT